MVGKGNGEVMGGNVLELETDLVRGWKKQWAVEKDGPFENETA